MIYELQQSSDLTFKLYDYNRLSNNKPRLLHIKESLDIITVPYKDFKVNKKSKILIDNKFFKLVKIDNISTKIYIWWCSMIASINY